MVSKVKVLRRLIRLAACVFAVSAAAPSTAEFLPPADAVALPDEKAVLTDALLKMLYTPQTGGVAALRTLDDALARLPKPTRLRGLVQFMRSAALSDGDKAASAREAIEESIRLLPAYSGPLLLASDMYAYSDQPARAADYLLRAARIDPDVVSRMDEYEVVNILHRLAFVDDHRRVRSLSERLLEIGWKAQTIEAQSSIVLGAIEARMAQAEVAGAIALIPKLLLPGHTQALLVQNRYSALWPDLERWAGPKLETQWRAYLAESRSRYEASRSPADSRAYLSALATAGHDETIIRTFLPIFSKPLDPQRDQELIFIVSPLANALARRGRWNDIDTLYDQALSVWPVDKGANALNLTANRARLLFERDRPLEGLKLMDLAIAEAAQHGEEVNASALAAMHHSRACMLHVVGRDVEAALARTKAGPERGPWASANLFLCMGQHDAAREVLIGALADQEDRDDVLLGVQPSDPPPVASAYGLASHARKRALRSDPKLLVAAAEHGRILPFGLRDGAPPETPIASLTP